MKSPGTYKITVKEAGIIAEYLKKAKKAVKLEEIVKATKKQVPWHPSTRTYQMIIAMNVDQRIVRQEGRGMYRFDASMPAPDVEPVPEWVAPKPPAPTTLAVSWKVPNVVIERPDVTKLKYGELLNGMVTRIEDYGIFVNCYDYDIGGLIHASKIRRGKMFFGVSDLERHFRVGEQLKVKVDSLREGKLALSTFDLDLPDYSNTVIADKLEPLKQPLKEPPKTAAPLTPASAPKTAESRPAPQTAYTAKSFETSGDKRELDMLYDMIKNKVGVISETAKSSLRDTVRDLGMVRVTMAVMSSGDFEADVSLAFVRHIEKTASERL